MLEPWLDPRLKTKIFLKAEKKMGGQLEKSEQRLCFLKCYKIVDSFLK